MALSSPLTPFVWKPAYSVQIRSMDAQHAELIRIVYDLQQAMAGGRGKEALQSILERLAAYTQDHFAAEERLLRQHAYPNFDSHKAEHDRLAATVAAYVSGHQSGRIALSVEVLGFLKSWLEKHILGLDKHYGAYLNSRGMT